MTIVRVKGTDKIGQVYWYTGCAERRFISVSEKDAFDGYNLIGAKRRADILNVMSDFHGIKFEAVEKMEVK